jgi:biopolymer transport protein ExbD
VLISSPILRTPGYSQWYKPLVLRIDKNGRWFLAGKPITAEQFPGALKGAFSGVPERVVYLEADPELEFGVPAKAIDTIRGLHAGVMLVTPVK